MLNALIGGLAGSLTAALLHKALKTRYNNDHFLSDLHEDDLPDIFDEGVEPEKKNFVTNIVLGDIGGNAALYSLSGLGSADTALIKGALAGVAAGASNLLLHEKEYTEEHGDTVAGKLLTLGVFIAGGLVAGAITQCLNRDR